MTDQEVEDLIRTEIENSIPDAVQTVVNDYDYEPFRFFIQHCAEELVDDYADVVESKLDEQPDEDLIKSIADDSDEFADYINEHLEDYEDDFDAYYDSSDLKETIKDYLGEITIENFHDALGDDPAYGGPENQPSGLSDEAEVNYAAFDDDVDLRIEDALDDFDLDFLLEANKVDNSDDAIELIYGDWSTAAEKVIEDW